MIVLNEKIYVEEHYLKNREVDKKPRDTLYLLAKYYYNVFSYKPSEVEKALNKYLLDNYSYRYNASKMNWEKTVENITKDAKNKKLFEIDSVQVTKAEMDKIMAINNRTLEKVLFAHLCLAKLYNQRDEKNNSWVNNDIKEIFDLAEVKKRKSERPHLLNELMRMGLLEFPKKTGNLASRVTFVDNSSDCVLSISDFRELGYEYLNYVGDGRFARCSDCGRLFQLKTKGRPKKYCDSCSKRSDRGNTKIVYCVDCGIPMNVPKSSRTIRCDGCKESEQKRIKRESERRRRDRVEVATI